MPFRRMRFFANRFEKLTLLSFATYVFLFALAAKLVFLYGSQHPEKHEMRVVDGIVKQVRIGGKGKATFLRVESGRGTHRYSSYYGKDWPGLERIRIGDRVKILAERNRLKRNEFISGKQYYIWELTFNGEVIVDYDDVRGMVTAKEETANRFANYVFAASLVFLAAASLRSRAIAG